MPPTSAVHTRTRSQRAQTTNASLDETGDSDAVPDGVVLEQPLPSELFLDPLHGSPLHFYVHEDVEDRTEINRLIRIHGGASSSSYTNANYILVDPRSAAGQNLYIQFYNNKKGKTILDSRWVKECVQAKELLAWRSNWAECRVTGKERDEYIQAQQANAQPIPPPPSPTHHINVDGSASQQPESSDELDQDVMEVDQLRGREETPPPLHSGESPGQIAPVTPQQVDPHRVAPHMYYSPHPLVYGYPPPRPGAPMPAPMPWPYMPNGHPMPMPMPMFAPPPHPDGQEGQPPTLTGAYPQFDYQHAQGYSNAWMEYYAQMDPNMYARQMEEHNYLMQSPGAENENEKRRRGRTRTRNLVSNSARIAVKPMGPPARSPSPPTNVVKSTYGGNLFTDEDVQYLKRYIAYCQEQGLLLSLREICERLAIKAPHHTFFSWRRYCNKHQIRLGAYTMEDRPEDAEGEEEENGLVNDSVDPEPATTSQSVPSGSGPSKTTRSGSPVPPKILYKSTTGKGVAFTNEDVQYLMDYMRYRKSKSEQLDMVEFWNDLSERAPHHSRASWMKYWRRHRHELEPNGDQPPAAAYVAPAKKSRYTPKDDILLAKYFFEMEGQDSSEKKTSDIIFQEFAGMHAHHPWKGWQEHHRIHKARIDHMIKQLKEGEEL